MISDLVAFKLETSKEIWYIGNFTELEPHKGVVVLVVVAVGSI